MEYALQLVKNKQYIIVLMDMYIAPRLQDVGEAMRGLCPVEILEMLVAPRIDSSHL